MRPLPAYAHRPGQTPHPRTHPQGHSHAAEVPTSLALTAANCDRHEAWRVGIDLFNGGYWWEAHEWWEAAWHATEDESFRHLLQGLIQLAACWLKWDAGNDRGRRGLWRRSRAHLLAAADTATATELDTQALVAQLDAWFDVHPIGPAAGNGPPQPIVALRQSSTRS